MLSKRSEFIMQAIARFFATEDPEERAALDVLLDFYEVQPEAD